jgi:SAM-dependent methyltransferase
MISTPLKELHQNTGKFWHTMSLLFHKGEEDLPQQLDSIMSELGVSKNDRILDAACGTGFPAIELHELGYKNLVCSDASPTTIDEFKKHTNLPVYELLWSEVGNTFSDLKAILVPGSSIAYVSSWDKPDETISKASAVEELKRSFQSFYEALAPHGIAVIGVSKNSDITEPKEFKLGEESFEGRKISVQWHITPLLKEGLRKWDTIITDSETQESEVITRYGVRVTIDEVIEMLKQSGFRIVELRDISPQHYDYQIIAQK